ncbi:T9SS type A sorting domain-containing protein, partial [bacterium]|nr:T9SS type A sorting domain-containing protein [bacterium]
DAGRPLFLAHMMPWYQSKPVSGRWGWHWTMNHFNPDRVGPDGRREIASQYYPLTGPYDSRDPDLLEYQTLLMILAGIDGVLVDWYGNEDYRDYGTLHEATTALFEAVGRAGLGFAVVYEDQTVKHMVNDGHLAASNALAYGKTVMGYMDRNWFGDSRYVKLAGRPLLLTFGPQYYFNSSDWESMFSGLSSDPLFFTLDNRLSPAAAGAYPWPPMSRSNADGILTQDALDRYLTQFYTMAQSWDFLVAGAFPGFNDIYEEAGQGGGYGYLDDGDGETFRSTLQAALDRNPDVIQLITWNDYGEGTMIEPTRENGYRDLETVQDKRKHLDTAFHFVHEDLRLPLRVWTLRKNRADDASVRSALNRTFGLITTGDASSASTVLDSLNTALYGNGDPDAGFALNPVFPNPFRSGVTVDYSLAEAGFADLSVFDAMGRQVDVLFRGSREAGRGFFFWEPDAAGSGLYFIRLSSEGKTAVRKAVRVK